MRYAIACMAASIFITINKHMPFSSKSKKPEDN